MEPLYEHDCNNCRFLGVDTRKRGEPQCNGVDMYVCQSPSGSTLVRRYSSEGPNYGAVPTEMVQDEHDRYAQMKRMVEAF